MKYYEINETAARQAHDLNSMYTFHEGAATQEYRGMVDRAYELAERQKGIVDPMYHEKIDALADRYARKLAENMNTRFSIEARVPSVLIAGPSNFPVRAKEKQNNARHKNDEEYRYIAGLLDKIRSTGTGGIRSGDPHALENLQTKLGELSEWQELMKRINAYYRKHKTLDECPELTQDQINKMKADMARDWRADPVPFPSYTLQNNNAVIRNTKARIAEVTERNEVGFAGWEFEGGKAVINMEADRLQLLFDEKPPDEQRAILGQNGFNWSRKNMAWQRQLTKNAISAANRIDFIKPTNGQSVRDLQPYTRNAQAKAQER